MYQTKQNKIVDDVMIIDLSINDEICCSSMRKKGEMMAMGARDELRKMVGGSGEWVMRDLLLHLALAVTAL